MRSFAILAALAIALATIYGVASQTSSEQPSASPESIAHSVNELGSDKDADRVRATEELNGIALQTKPEQPNASPESIAHLVDQLGNAEYADRVRATKELDDIGSAALAQLRIAMTSADAEIKNRATSLVRKIEVRDPMLALLAPKRVSLQMKNASIIEALAELAKQSGYPIVLTGDTSPLYGRKFTIDTGYTPFWEALRVLTEIASLTEVSYERTPLPQRPSSSSLLLLHPTNPPRSNDPADRLKELQALQEQRLKDMKALQEQLTQRDSQVRKAIRLAPGVSFETPTCITGSFRIRLYDTAIANNGDVDLLLEVRAEPRLDFFAIAGESHIEVARDDMDQLLVPVPVQSQIDKRLTITDGGTGTNGRLVLVRMKAGSTPSKSIKTLTGKILVETTIDTEPARMVFDDVMSSVDTFKSKQGVSFKMQWVSGVNNGDVRCQIIVESQQKDRAYLREDIFGAIERFVSFNGNKIRCELDLRTADRMPPPRLVDAVGNPFHLFDSTENWERAANGQFLTVMYLRYRPAAGQGPPTRLILPETRPINIEVPFTLRDIKLP